MAPARLRLLVQASRDATSGQLAFATATAPLVLKPLMPSIERRSAGLGSSERPVWHVAEAAQEGVNPWDACHALLERGLGVAGGEITFAEPDLEQSWLWTTTNRQAFGITAECQIAAADSDIYPIGNTDYWFADEGHSQLDEARPAVGKPRGNGIRIAHLDTGYDENHATKPVRLRTDLARNFVDADRPMDATDRPTAVVNPMFGHGTGTLSILAGNAVSDGLMGGAANLEIVPVRVANWVVLFSNSAIAQAFDYVHSLWSDERTRVHVVTMSMGGIASAAWADAVNALYGQGIFVVTAAGNNFGNLPTRYIVYPARFNRVIAACGVMADGRPYADLPIRKMAGCYGPMAKDPTTVAAYTPNVPWAKFGCPQTIDLDGGGTSAATPQIAAAVALWMQKNKAQLDAMPSDKGWMRVEAARKALFDSIQPPDSRQQGHVGRGLLRANEALAKPVAAESLLQATPPDSASFPVLRVLTGLGMAAAPDARQRMLELEALQISQQSSDIEQLLEAFDASPSQATQSPLVRRLTEALISHPTASAQLKATLGGDSKLVAVPQASAAVTPAASGLKPEVPQPSSRRLWVYARDPLMSIEKTFYDLNEVELEVPWDINLEPGPVGEYLEVIDVDPPAGRAYAPVDLNHPRLLAQSGYKPTEGNPQFHQQMVYAVAMKTIGHFERALGRVALWAPRYADIDGEKTSWFVRRLRIYPHALREANAYYSPERRALLFGYFRASSDGGENLLHGLVFNCLSHDVIAHETTHALLDGLHSRYKEPTNPDLLAFHEAFADIVALFQHFTIPSILTEAIRRARGHAGLSNSLAGLAVQFGQAIGNRGALRSAIDGLKPTGHEYQSATEPHARGAVLVAAIFAAFRQVYDRKTRDLFRLATGGTGVLPKGEIPHDLANRLAVEAAEVAAVVLQICIRALDYCPPVDLTFGEYLRALVTADRDLVPDDPDGYRVAFINAFRERGIYPAGVSNLSVDALAWQKPDIDGALTAVAHIKSFEWDLSSDRRSAFLDSNNAARTLYHRFINDKTPSSALAALGLVRAGVEEKIVIDGKQGTVYPIEIHSVRPARRIGIKGEIRSDVIIEMTQKWMPDGWTGSPFRGGCTLVCDLDTGDVRYAIRKRVGHGGRAEEEQQFRGAFGRGHPPYFDDGTGQSEPFAMLHRGI